jgi:hypothetical protein
VDIASIAAVVMRPNDSAVRAARQLCRQSLRYFGDVTEADRVMAVATYVPVGESVPADRKFWSPSVAKAVSAIEERQEFHRISSVLAIDRTRCRHGFPRAYIVSASLVYPELWLYYGTTVTSSFLCNSNVQFITCKKATLQWICLSSPLMGS